MKTQTLSRLSKGGVTGYLSLTRYVSEKQSDERKWGIWSGLSQPLRKKTLAAVLVFGSASEEMTRRIQF